MRDYNLTYYNFTSSSEILDVGMKYLYCLSNNNDIRFGGHYVCATKVNDVYHLNDDNKPIRIVSQDFVEKNSVLLAIRHGNV